MREFDLKDTEKLLAGLTVLGTGGGGEAEWGRILLRHEVEHGRPIRVVDPQEVEDDAFVCSGGIMGSVKSLDDVSFEDITEEWETMFPLVEAIKLMEKLQGKQVNYLIPFEAGGLNTPVVMAAAARLGIPVIDADGNGRSTPETQMISFIGFGIDLYPMPLVDRYGNTSVVVHGNNTTYADEVGRFIVVKGGGLGANAHYGMTGQQVKAALVPGAISKSIKIGEILENSDSEQRYDALLDILKAKKLFEGKVDFIESVNKGGFYLTELTLKNEETSDTAKVVIKNETMAMWVNGELKAILPDHIYMIDPVTHQGVPSVELEMNKEVRFLGAPCHERVKKAFRTPKGQEAFGPARFGYPDLPYKELD
ncbi:MAG: DUF917 domain-containing protein [Saccharofermentanales bacterium]|jgi:DUF917 family protein